MVGLQMKGAPAGGSFALSRNCLTPGKGSLSRAGKAQRSEPQTQKLENVVATSWLLQGYYCVVMVQGDLQVAVTLEYMNLCRSVSLQHRLAPSTPP